MSILRSAAIVAATSLASPALAQSGSPSIEAWSTRVGTDATIDLRTAGSPGSLFAVYATASGASIFGGRSTMLARGRFDPSGDANASLPFKWNVPENFSVDLHIVTRGADGLQVTTQRLPLSGNGGTLCQEFDPNFALGAIEPVPGESLSTQWEPVGLTVSAQNNVATNPQTAITFDSANPTGGDDDLATPGFGPGNTEAFGQLIIVAENDVDANGDGLVDSPDDEEFGGTISFDFADPYRMCSATLVDIDDQAPSEMRFFVGDAMTVQTIPVPFQGDNGVQTLTFDVLDVRRFELVLGGSGAIARLQMVPCPISVNLDEGSFGRPLDVQAGTEITDQFASVGLTVSALNNTAGNPDKAILFDSGNPTGDDDDLMTPGLGINNTDPLGFVLILAENDVDANGDGLVDDPDDEEFGGQFNLSFSEPVTFFSTRVLDVDGTEFDEFRFFDDLDVLINTVDIGSLGDNSVQDLTSPTTISGVSRIEVIFTGSGALTRLRWCPDSNVSAVSFAK